MQPVLGGDCVCHKSQVSSNDCNLKGSYKLSLERKRVILVNMEISVILGHEKTKIRNIIDYGKIDIFSVRTNIHIKNKMMGHLI